MSSTRGGLVGARVKMFEDVPVDDHTTSSGRGIVGARVQMFQDVSGDHLTPLCSFPDSAPLHQHRKVQIIPETNSRSKLSLRPAPAVPQQQRHLTSAKYPAAEASEPLLSTLDNYADADCKITAGPRAVPGTVHNMVPWSSVHAASCTSSGHSEVSYKALGALPPPPPSTNHWGKFRDCLSASAARIQRSSPLTLIRDNFSTVCERFEKTIPTKRREFKLGLLIILGCFVWLILNQCFISNDDTDVDEFFYNLKYSPDHLLVYQGETLSAIPKEGTENANQCIVTERMKQTASNGKSEVGVVASNEHRTFPGSLLLANKHLVDNTPDLLAVDRAPLTYTVNLPGLTSDGSFTIVPSFSEYQAAVNRVLNTWFEKYPSDRSTPAHFQSVESFAYSKQLLRVKFGLEFMNSVLESNIDFNAMGKGEKLIKVYKFTQVFYTVSVEPTKRPSDLFDPGVTLREIMRKTDEKNPPVLVDSVSYGRNIYVKIETTSIEKQAELNLSILDLKPGNLETAHELKDLHIQIYVVGGNPNHTKLIDVKEMNEVRDIITKFSKFTKDNLGFPISYSSHFIKDNKKAVVHLSSDYVESVRLDYCRNSIIKLIQDRWFGSWEVTWTEISYDKNGNRIERKRGWDKNSRVIKLSFRSEDIEIPSNAEDLKVVAQFWTLFDSWRTVINRSNIPLIPRREFHVYSDMTSDISPSID